MVPNPGKSGRTPRGCGPTCLQVTKSRKILAFLHVYRCGIDAVQVHDGMRFYWKIYMGPIGSNAYTRGYGGINEKTLIGRT